MICVESGQVDQGGATTTYILIQLLKIENLGGLIVISGIYVVAIAMTWIRAKKYEKSVKEERALEEAKA